MYLLKAVHITNGVSMHPNQINSSIMGGNTTTALLLITLACLAAIADLWTSRLAESRGALEGNKLLQRADGRMSMPKAIAFKALAILLCAWSWSVDPLLGGFGLGIISVGQIAVALHNWGIYRR
jgi:hypothetical protein